MEQENQISGDQLEGAAPVSDVLNEANNEQQPRLVPLEALESERHQRQQVQEELKLIKDHLSLMQAHKQEPRQQSEFDKLQDDDVLTVGEAKKFISTLNNQYKASLDEIKISQRYPDYAEVVTKYLPEVIKNNPGLKQTLQNTQDYELAYYLAKNSDAYRQSSKKTKVSQDAERIVQNSNRAGTLSTVGHDTPISMARRYKDMSDDDFRRLVNKNMGSM